MLRSRRLILPRRRLLDVSLILNLWLSKSRRQFSAKGTAEGNVAQRTGLERSGKGRLFVSASEIANLVNANPHLSVGDAVERFWQKNNKRTFTEALVRNKLQSFTPEEKLTELGVLSLAMAAVAAEEPSQYRQSLDQALKHAKSAQDEGVVRDFINTARGVKNEKNTFESLQKRQPLVRLDSDPTLYQKVLQIPNSEVEYVISGYIDGVETDNNRIIEIKNRQNRLFNYVPLYEQVQCQAYLFLTGFSVCEHTESFRGTLQSTTLRYEPLFWERVVERLNQVLVAFDLLTKDASAQDAFLQTRNLFEATQKNQNSKRGRPRGKVKSLIYKMDEDVENSG
jgi:hypothetical protein